MIERAYTYQLWYIEINNYQAWEAFKSLGYYNPANDHELYF